MKKLSLKQLRISSIETLRFVCVLAAVMHITFFMFFLMYKVAVLMYFNIGSVTFYITGSIVLRNKFAAEHNLAWVIAIFSEIVVHAVLCTLLLGVDTCFVLYPIVVLPICSYFLFLRRDNSKVFMRVILAFALITLFVTTLAVALAEYSGGSLQTNMAVLSRKEKMILRSVNITFSAVILYGFTVLFFLEITRLMEKLRESTAQLKYTATHDALTGLTNRRSFWDYFDNLCRDCEHYNIAMGDLDSFKKINDTYGHGCGDLVLKSVADIINDGTGENEIACRWGGEEMVVVFIGERTDALLRLEEIRKKIEALRLTYEGLIVHVTMTFGFADSTEIKLAADETIEIKRSVDEHFDRENSDFTSSNRSGMESLISMADKRLYIGKGSGKNKVVDK